MRCRVALLFVLAVALIVAQRHYPHEELTFGDPNGRYWLVASPDFKLGYVIGSGNALANAAGRAHAQPGAPCEAEAKATYQDLRPSQMSNAEIRTGLDEFYADPANVLIDIHGALEIVGARSRGVPQAAIEQRVLTLRRISLGAPEHQ